MNVRGRRKWDNCPSITVKSKSGAFFLGKYVRLLSASGSKIGGLPENNPEPTIYFGINFVL